MPRPKQDAAATVAGWLDDPDKSISSRMGADMMAGEWRTTDDVVALGANGSNLSQVCRKLQDAGYRVDKRPGGPNGRMAYTVTGQGPATNGKAPAVMEHPPVGAKVTVRAVAMGGRGELVVHLSDGRGHGWTATVTGYTDQ